MTAELILDLIVIGIIVIFVIRGMARGLVKTLSGLVALVAGIFGGIYIGETFSGAVGKKWIAPWVLKTLDLAFQGVQIPQGAALEGEGGLTEAAGESLAGIFKSSGLPSFSFDGAIDIIGDQIRETGSEMLEAATNVISERIAYILLFIAAFFTIQLLVRLIFWLISLIMKAPVLNTLNRLAGGALGLLTGLLLVVLFMWVGITFVKPATEPGSILSEGVLSGTFLAKYFDSLRRSIFT
jgi:uncharacterized membrane protein required for colicin V production